MFQLWAAADQPHCHGGGWMTDEQRTEKTDRIRTHENHVSGVTA